MRVSQIELLDPWEISGLLHLDVYQKGIAQHSEGFVAAKGMHAQVRRENKTKSGMRALAANRSDR
jgi:hypothetical protein